MSRVAKKPINLPKGVECQVKADAITVKGPKGTLAMAAPAGVDVTIDGGQIKLSAKNADSMDFTAQIQAHLVSHQYESLLKKANLRGR